MPAPEVNNERHGSAPWHAGGERRGHHLRIPRWKRPVHLQRAARLRHQARPGQARAVRRTHGGRIREGQERTRDMPGDQRTGHHEPGHRDRHRIRGLRADDSPHGTGRRGVPGPGRVPGGRRLQPADAHHEAQLQGPRRREAPPRDQRGLGHLPHGQEGARPHRPSRRPDGQEPGPCAAP